MNQLDESLNNEDGLTLIEILVASSIASIIFMGLMSSSLFFKKHALTLEVKYAARHHIMGIMEQLRSNIGIFQVMNSTNEEDINRILAVDKLPLAWDSEKLVDLKECENCPGKMGYLILPVDGFDGLYKVKFAVYHHLLGTSVVNFEYYVSEK